MAWNTITEYNLAFPFIHPHKHTTVNNNFMVY